MTNELQTPLTENQLLVLNKFRKRLLREKYINNYASNYYGTMQHWFIIPGILITGISSIASFLATSDIFNNDTKSGFTIGVGILTAGATILQSVSSAFGFGTRKDAFQKSADSYDSLITKLEFEICNPNEQFTVFCSELEKAILKIKSDCVYLPPLFIIAKYEAEVAKTNVHVEGSPSKEMTFEDVIMKQKNNTNSMRSNNISHNSMPTNNASHVTTPINSISGSMANNINHIISHSDIKIDMTTLQNGISSHVDSDEPLLVINTDVHKMESTNNNYSNA